MTPKHPCNIRDIQKHIDTHKLKLRGVWNLFEYCLHVLLFKRQHWWPWLYTTVIILIQNCLSGRIFPLSLWRPQCILGFPGGTIGKESTCQCKRRERHGSDPWVRNISWSGKRQVTLVFLPDKFHGKRNLEGYSPWGLKESDTTEQLSRALHF